MEISDKRITNPESENLMSSFQLDLVAYFKIVEADVYKLLTQAQREGWNEGKLISEVERLFDDPQSN